MDCPHCGEDTDPTLLYCKFCGQAIELDPEAVQKHIERDEEKLAIEHLEERTRIGLYAAAFSLVAVIALRLVVIAPVPGEVSVGYYPPAQIVQDKNLDPPAGLDLPVEDIDIPNDDRTKK